MDRDMTRARGELEAAIGALQGALSVLSRASWMRDTSPDGLSLWQEACRGAFIAADNAQRNVYRAAQTGSGP
jgi:hypothetical protein